MHYARELFTSKLSLLTGRKAEHLISVRLRSILVARTCIIRPPEVNPPVGHFPLEKSWPLNPKREKLTAGGGWNWLERLDFNESRLFGPLQKGLRPLLTKVGRKANPLSNALGLPCDVGLYRLPDV